MERRKIKTNYCIQENICTRFIFTPSAIVRCGDFKTGRVPISQIISLETQLCLGEFKTRRRILQVQNLRAKKKPRDEYFRAYSMIVYQTGCVRRSCRHQYQSSERSSSFRHLGKENGNITFHACADGGGWVQRCPDLS